jgi:uncharacterized protein (TIGR00255 family)
MTGFGRASETTDDVTVWAEVFSLNHRHLDIGVRLSPPLNLFENDVRKLVQSRLGRGRVNISISLDGNPPEASQLDFNRDLAKQYLDKVRDFANDADLKDDVSAMSILRIGSLWTTKTPNPEDMAGLWELAQGALTEALEQLLEMRKNEGENIWQDLARYIQQLKSVTGVIGARAPVVVDEYRERLKKRIDQLLPSGTELDEQRLLAEVALFAERADISEELARFESHIEQFSGLADQESDVGRRLDFLIQEMFREATTIGSKARDSETSHAVVELKGVLEKMREQVQNVE